MSKKKDKNSRKRVKQGNRKEKKNQRTTFSVFKQVEKKILFDCFGSLFDSTIEISRIFNSF